MIESIKFVIYGIIMGVANVIPGVSGGTMAIILNFYDRLMESITLNFKVLKKNLPFLIPLGLGVCIGIIGFSKVMKFLLEQYTAQTYFGFIGIVLGSLPLIWHKASQHSNIKKTSWVPFLICLGLMIGLSFANGDKESAKELIKYTTLNPVSFIVCLISMTIATATMIIPGISGSLILIIIGMYGTIYGYAIAEFNIPLLIPCGLGALLGIFGGAKSINYLLKNFEQPTYLAILGLLLGSLFELIKQSSIVIGLNSQFISSILIMLVLLALIYWFSIQEIKRDLK